MRPKQCPVQCEAYLSSGDKAEGGKGEHLSQPRAEVKMAGVITLLLLL